MEAQLTKALHRCRGFLPGTVFIVRHETSQRGLWFGSPVGRRRWVARRERGLSANEATDFELWLTSDERHGVALRNAGIQWRGLDRLVDEDAAEMLRKLRRRREGRSRLRIAGLSIDAACFWVFWFWPGSGVPNQSAMEVTTDTPRALTLTDGTRVLLNAGAVLRDLERPFVVVAGATEVRAVGTAFNLSLGMSAVEVIVTESVVKVSAEHGVEPQLGPMRLVNSG